MAEADQDRKLGAAVGLCLVAATFASYFGVVDHEFLNYDDLRLVVDNPGLTAPPTLPNLLAHFGAPEAGNSNWLPLYWISLQLGFALHGPNPAAFLLTNVFLHATSAVLLFASLRAMSGAFWCSAFVAAVFALHPLHVESVAWVTERKDVLAGLFWMLGLLAYARYAAAPTSKARYFAVLLCLVLGLLCKATLVTFPAVLLLLDVWPLARIRGAVRRVLLEKLPMFAIAAAASAATIASQRGVGNIELGARIGFGSRLANAVESYWSYLLDALWPLRLAALYPHPYLLRPVSEREAAIAVGLGLALISLTLAILLASRRRPYLGVGWLWYLGTLVPMIGLVQVGLQARADRYMYLPLIGLSIMLAWGAADLVPARRRKPLAALAALVSIALASATRAQLEHWRDSISLFERAVAVTERNRYAHERLAYELLQVERFEDARAHYRAALRIEPARGPLHYGLALSHEREGNVEAAIASYREGLRVQPDMVLADGSLGLLLLREGRPAAARRHLQRATRGMPGVPEYREALEAARDQLEHTRPDSSER